MDQIDYGPLCRGTWEDYAYPGRTNLGSINLTCAQPDTRNMTKGQIDSINAAWDMTFKRAWGGPSIRLNPLLSWAAPGSFGINIQDFAEFKTSP